MLLRNILLILVFSSLGLSAFASDYMTESEVMEIFDRKIVSTPANMQGYGERTKQENLLSLSSLILDDQTRLQKDFEKADRSSLPNSVDLRRFDSSIKNQFNGTCTAFSTVANTEFLACLKLNKCNLDLSERHFWSFYEAYSAAEAIRHTGKPIAPETLWKQDQEAKPTGIDNQGIISTSGWKYGYNNIDLLLKVLSEGKAVKLWAHVPKEMAECRSHITKKEYIDGGHDFKISGYFDKNNPVLIVKNSWGNSCGDKGYQYLRLTALNQTTSGVGYWNFAYADTVTEHKKALNCRPRFLIFGRICD